MYVCIYRYTTCICKVCVPMSLNHPVAEDAGRSHSSHRAPGRWENHGKLYGKTIGNPNEFHGKLGSSMDIFL